MVMNVDRHWHKFRLAVRNDLTGFWEYTDMPPPPTTPPPYKPATASLPPVDASANSLTSKLLPSFVAIDFFLPYLVDGMKATQFYGPGFIVSTDPPLIVCDRDTVPISVGDIEITFANSIIIPGKLLFLHPFYNFVVLTYDPALIGDTPVKPIQFADEHVQLSQGDEVYFTSVSTDNQISTKKATISSVSNVGTRECSPPRWRAMNVEGIKVDDAINSSSQGGLFTDADGNVHALWVSYSTQNEKGKDLAFMSGLPASLVRPTLERFMQQYKNGTQQPVVFKGLDVEMWTMRLAAARTLGLSDDWVRKVEQSGSTRHSLPYIINILDERSPSAKALKVGDVVLSINDQLVTRLADLTKVIHATDDTVDMMILRNGKEMQVKVPMSEFSDYETTRVIHWQGALIQTPYKAVLEQVRNVPDGVYVSCTLYGSPASNVLRPGVWIVEVNGQAVHDLDSFLSVVHAHETEMLRRRRPSYVPPVQRKNVSTPDQGQNMTLEQMVQENEDDEDDDNDEGYIRIKTVSRNETVRVAALKLDLHYWDTWQLVKDDASICGWKCIEA